ncbi:MAG: right-handed parallel beta-helix repeat-containing protein [Alphaproteobacteria bacterium]
MAARLLRWFAVLGTGIALTGFNPQLALARVLTVGPAGEFRVPSAAAKAARDGDTIEIAAGTYTGDAAVWRQNAITIRGVGGRPVLDAAGKSAEGKAIWVIKGDNVVIDNIAFVGARVSDRNGAGIRHEGGRLTIRNSLFRDNENGILTKNDRDQSLVIEGSEFADNGIAGGSGQVHAIYAGSIRELSVRSSYFHGTKIGHHIKSRAQTTTVLCNYIVDGPDGTASFEVDISIGGDALIMGNVMHKGFHADNTGMIAYGNEGLKNEGRSLIVLNNTLVTDVGSGVFVRIGKKARPMSAHISNNIFIGKAALAEGTEITEPNLYAESIDGSGDGALGSIAGAIGPVADPGFIDAANGDFRLAAGSPAIDAGTVNAAIDGERVVPDCEYVHPASERPRPSVGEIDLGSYEYEGS